MARETIRVEIWISDLVVPGGGCLTTATAEPGNLNARGKFDPESVPDDVIADAISAMDDGSLDAEATETLGRTLFDSLIRGDIATLYETAQQRGRIRLRLVIDVPAAQRIPWELLHDGKRFVAIAGPLARGISSLVPAEPPIATFPLRILAVDAFPSNERHKGQREVEGITTALAPLTKDGLAHVTPVNGATVEKLLDELRTATAEPDPHPFHILHFIGHSQLDEETGDSYLLFGGDETKPRHAVRPDDLVDIIGDYDLKLVFLNSCESVGTSTLATAETFAPVLLESGIPAVIGMQISVFESAARIFAEEFYKALADNRPVDEALTDARRIAKTKESEYVSDVGVPVCYLRSESGRILDLRPPPEAGASSPRRIFTKLIDYVVAAIVGALVLALGGYFMSVLRGPERMNELRFNVAVAEFAAADGASTSTSKDLSIRLAEQLENALAELEFTDVWGPEQAGLIGGDTPEQRAESADVLADRINADVLVYGVLRGEGSEGQFVPEFFINDRQLSGASELTGPYVLGGGDPFDSSLDAVDELQDRLAGRTRGLALFVIGLSAYSREKYERALSPLQQASQVEDWSDEDGKELTWLFLGNTYGRLLDYTSAGTAYEEALTIAPDYARALIGRADITFQQSRGNCFPPDDPAGLELAEFQFREALAAPDMSPLADIETKATYGLGRVVMCKQIGGVPSDMAAPFFEKVIHTYETGDEATQRRLEELASESHANLGALFATVAPVDLAAAIVEYEKGINLASADERKAVFLGNQADAYRKAGECGEARAALDRALTLTRIASLKDQLIDQREKLSC